MDLDKYTAVITYDNEVLVYDETNTLVGYLIEHFSSKRAAQRYAKQFGKIMVDSYEF